MPDAEFGIAWNFDPENPNPHAWEIGAERFPTYAAAEAEAEELCAEDDWASFLICRIKGAACGQPLYESGEIAGHCSEPRYTEHDHG